MESAAPVRPVAIGWSKAEFEHRWDGSILVRPMEALGPYPDRAGRWLERWARATPEQVFLAERDADGTGWRTLRYGEALAQARAIGQALLDRGLSAERPVAILSGNGIDHALLMLACLHVGVPVAPVSTAYSLQGAVGGFAKLRHCLGLLTPGLVFAADATQYGRALRDAVPADAEVVTSGPAPDGRTATPFAALLATQVSPAVDRAAAAVVPDTVAKVLFTSGSTGQPKGVTTTHRMLCSNQQQILQCYPVLGEEPPVLADWLPWSHVFGGNHNLGIVLANGGTLYIDPGRPLPGAFEETVRTLREVAPTAYYNVAKGYEELAQRLEADAALRARFFSRVQLLFYAAASLPQSLWDRMDSLAVQAGGERIQWMTGLGCTETAPFALSGRPDIGGAGIVGLPVPGLELKLTPVHGKLEARMRGPNVLPGYWRSPAATAAAFDEEGFLRTGDALLPADPADPQQGFRFDGRVTEDFKLATGTWVSVGPLRLRLLDALQPHVRDLVVAGLDRDFLAVLAIPARPEAATDHAVRAELLDRMAALAAEASGSSVRVRRLVFLTAPLSVDSGEMTDKGSINQRRVLESHAHLVEQLYAHPPPPHVLCIDRVGAPA